MRLKKKKELNRAKAWRQGSKVVTKDYILLGCDVVLVIDW
jgi:hypothetical protein